MLFGGIQRLVWVGLLIFGTLIAALAAGSRSPPVDPFGAASPPNLDNLMVPELANAKLRHARHRPAYTVGLFGNSRSVAVSARDVGGANGAFFNYSIPGASIRSSVALIEELGRLNRLPRVVVVSLDHFALDYFPDTLIPPPAERLGRTWEDFQHLLAWTDAGTALLVPWRRARLEWRNVKSTWTLEPMLRALAWRAGFAIDVSTPDPHRGYQSDGSRPYGTSNRNDSAVAIAPRAGRNVIAELLELELGRLATATHGRSRVIIYETPVQTDQTSRPAGQAALRDLVSRACSRHGWTCSLDPGPLDSSTAWPDATHPPTEILGPLITALIARS